MNPCTRLLTLGILFAFAGSLCAIEFEAQVDKREMAPDEDITVTVQVTGENLKEEPPFPEFEPSTDFTLLNKNRFQSSSQNISIVNGRMARSMVIAHTFQFTFKPARTGDLKLPGFKFQFKDFQRVVAPTPIKVVKDETGADGGGGEVDIAINFKKTSLVLNEQSLLTVVLRKRADAPVQQIRRPEIEKEFSKYFWIKPTTDKVQGKMENLNGTAYEVYRLDFIIFPILAGEVKIPSLPLQYSVIQQQRGQRRQRDPFFGDPFFDNFFGANVTTKERTKYSRPVTLSVRSLPETGKPAGFSGAVGEFTLLATVDNRTPKAGEALNVKVIISGRGNEKSVNPPSVANAGNFEIFDPEIQSDVAIKSAQVVITKTFRYVVIPQAEGKQLFGPITLYYFNPARGAYDSAQAKIELDVQKGKVQAASAARYLSKEEIRMVGRDIRYIKTEGNDLRDGSQRFYRSGLFLLLVFLPFFSSAVFLVVRRQNERLRTDVEYARLKKARKIAGKRLAQAAAQIASSAGGEFYATLVRGLSGYAADKLNIPAAGVTNAELAHALEKRGVSADTILALTGFLDECDLYRFGNITGDESDRRAKYQRAEGLISRLEKELR
ncbi:MAG: BatD family protein [Fibrobacterota bacterium]